MRKNCRNSWKSSPVNLGNILKVYNPQASFLALSKYEDEGTEAYIDRIQILLFSYKNPS